MHDAATQIEAAWAGGDWGTTHALAETWLREVSAGGGHDPRPAFALNVGYLIQGEMAKAWTFHDQALQEVEDIDTVTTWLREMRERHPSNGYLQLVMGLCLSQGGQSEHSIESFKQAIAALPALPHPHFFLGQVYERATRTDLAIK